MAAQAGVNLSEYQVLLGLQKELVDRITESGTDVEVLVSRAISKGLISLQGLEANATSTARSGRERAEQFVARVLEAIRGNPSGERTTLFLQILEDLSLSPLSEFIRSKLAGSKRVAGDTHHDAPPLAHRPGPPHQPPGGAYGGQPKLAPADEEDSGIVGEGDTNDNNDNANSGVEAEPQVAPANTGSAGFKTLSNGVIALKPKHSDNLAVSPRDDPPVISRTQSHTSPPVATSSPMITGMTNAPPVLPAVAQMQQENQELRVRVAEMAGKEKCLQQQLSQLEIEKEEGEQLLEEKDKELEKVKREKDEKIQSLKDEVEEKEKKVEELQHKLSQQEKRNEALKTEYETEIAELKEKMEKMEANYTKETLRLTKEKHELELKLQKMLTREAEIKQQIAEEKLKTVSLEAENTKLQAQKEVKEIEEKMRMAKRQHRDGISQNKKLVSQLKEKRAKFE